MPIEKRTKVMEIEVEQDIYQCDRCLKVAEGSLTVVESTNGKAEYKSVDWDTSPAGWRIIHELAAEDAPHDKKPQLCKECVETFFAEFRKWIADGRAKVA